MPSGTEEITKEQSGDTVENGSDWDELGSSWLANGIKVYSFLKILSSEPQKKKRNSASSLQSLN